MSKTLPNMVAAVLNLAEEDEWEVHTVRTGLVLVDKEGNEYKISFRSEGDPRQGQRWVVTKINNEED